MELTIYHRVTIDREIQRDPETDIRMTRMLEQILEELRTARTQGRREMTLVQDIQTKMATLLTGVENESDSNASIIALLTGQTALIVDLRQQLQDAIANGASPAELQAIVDGLATIETINTTKRQEIVDAIFANTTPTTDPVSGGGEPGVANRGGRGNR